MKNLLITGLLASALSSAPLAYSHSEHSHAKEDSESASLRVVASIRPLHSLVQAVLGQTGEAAVLVDQQSPHHFSLKPSQVRLLHNADVVFAIDVCGFETFMRRAVEGMPKRVRRAMILPAGAVRVALPQQTSGERFMLANEGEASDGHGHEHGHDESEADEHEDAHEDKDKHEHEHGHDEHEEESDAAVCLESASGETTDPHVWLSVDNAAAMVAHIRDVLSQQYPQHAAVYAKNAAAYAQRLQALKAEMAQQLQPHQNKTFVTQHDAFLYFEKEQGLQGRVLLINPNLPLSAKRVGDIQAFIREQSINTIFLEPQFSQAQSQRLLAAVGFDGKVQTIDPLGANLPLGADLYIEMMRQIATQLAENL